MSRNRIILVTAGIMLSLFLASMESTVVATAMPTIVGQLGGLEHYSWVFSAFMLASTTSVPLYGKISDLYGRRKLYVFAMALFLMGSILCGWANSMTGLIFARAIQGLGAGGIMPLAFILIGEMFTLEQRAKMQGFFSGVWGVSSIIGPLLGGFLVDQLSWRWIFYINIVPGLLAAGLVAFAWRDQARSHERPAIDYAGAALLTVSVVMLLLGLMETGVFSWILIAVAIALFILLLWVERRAADPVLPLNLFRERLFSTAAMHGILTGWALFGSISFIPLFVQAVLDTSATQAGITITPMLLGWVTASIIGTRLLLTIGYRKLGLIGTATFTVGAFLMSRAGMNTNQITLMIFVALMGIGMGLSIPGFLIAVQTSVERRQLGTATSTLQFSRSIGGTLGVSAMGAALSTRLASNLIASHLDPELVRQLLDPLPGSEVVIVQGARAAMANAIHLVFVIAFIAAVLAMITVLFTPRTELREQLPEPEGIPVSAD
ncbi:MAG TPA: MDR family MFS transporter [Anaerolineales bacterium]|nr:MDR family MFS transporter [Anaerolineales bacterium]HLO31930.1 MDR family MFS transporter [Anaerolineales bacterium]